MVSRLDETFQRLRQPRRAAFVAYICAGDPNLRASLDIVLALESVGVDIIELGVPFSDPLADGIVNQMAAQRALESGTTVPGVIDLVREVRRRSQIPLVLFTYLNPVYAYGFERFHADAAAAGADGILLLDLPPDEAALNSELSGGSGLNHIRLIAPTTPPERMREIASRSEGFVYYVSRTGVTGTGPALSADIGGKVAVIKSATAVPVCVGFGISTPEQVACVARVADGVVVGSAIVRQIEEHEDSSEIAGRIAGFVKPLVSAARAV
jgi:tryptophan synthase alpha chain